MFKRHLLSLGLVCAFICAPFTSRPPSAWADAPSDASAQLVDAGSGSAAAPLPLPATPVLVTANPCQSGQHAIVDPAGVTTCSELPPKAADLPNPAAAPVQAWDDAKAARKVSWPLAVWAALAMLGKALAYGREKLKTVPIVGKAAEWLSVGKRAMVVAAIGTVGSAGYDVLISGGSVVAALVASGIAIAGTVHSTTKGAATATT